MRLSVSILESPDFNEKSVGIWNEFFKEPAADADTRAEIRKRLVPFLETALAKTIGPRIRAENLFRLVYDK